DRAELGRVPAGALVDARAPAPRLGHGDAAAADQEYLAVDAGRLGAGEPGDQRGDVAGRTRVPVALGGPGATAAQVLGHAGAGPGRDGVGRDAVAGQFLGRDLGEAGDARLGRSVVALARVGEQARRR